MAKYIIVGKKALTAQKAKLEAIQMIDDSFAAKEAALVDTQDLAEVLLYAEAKLGEMLSMIEPKGNTLTSSGGRKVTLPEVVTRGS